MVISMIVVAIPTVAVMLPVMTMLKPVIGTIMPTLEPVMETAVLPAAHVPSMGAVMLSLEPVMNAIVPLFEAVVLAGVAMSPAAFVRHRGCRHAKREDGADNGKCKFTHCRILLHFPGSPS